jgi:hypothetical protein
LVKSTANKSNLGHGKLLMLHVFNELNDWAHANVPTKERDIGLWIIVHHKVGDQCVVWSSTAAVADASGVDEFVVLLEFKAVPSRLRVDVENGGTLRAFGVGR